VLVVAAAFGARAIDDRRACVLAAALIVVSFLVRSIVTDLRRKNPAASIAAAARVWGRPATNNALEAVAFAQSTSSESRGVSHALAQLHAQRALDHLPLRALDQQASKRTQSIHLAALVAFVAAAIALVAFPHFALEGLDALVAKDHRAPVPITEFSSIEATVTPPDYLHQEPASHRFVDDSQVIESALLLPVGSNVALHATPVGSAQKWVVEVGDAIVAFVDDGQSGLVARFEVREPVTLKLATVLAGTLIEDPHEITVTVIADEAPRVTLEGAPRTMKLDEVGSGLELKYDAEDDNGLREIALVVQSGNKLDRRTIAQLDGEPKHDRGGYTLHGDDPSLRSHLPMRVSIEARDNDVVTGPKWGKSEVILVNPPDLGAPQAERVAAARSLRQQATKLVALASEPKLDRQKVIDQLAVVDGLATSVTTRVPKAIRKPALAIRGVLSQVRGKSNAKNDGTPFGPNPGEKTGPIGSPKWIEAAEKLDRLADRAYLVMGSYYAKVVATSMSAIALEASKLVRDGDAILLASDLKVLTDGASSMREMGVLGEDLGTVSQSALRRYNRAQNKGNRAHQALILLDLGERLADASASYVGGGGSGDGVGESTEKGDGESDDEKAADDQANELEDLVKDHRANTENVDSSLEQASDDASSNEADDEAKKRAQELRESVAMLPRKRSSSTPNDTSEAREQAEDAARSIERRDTHDAIEKLKNTKDSLKCALSNPQVGDDERDRAERSERLVQRDLDWLQEQERKTGERASEKAKDQLKNEGDREGELRQRGEKLRKLAEKHPLPEGVDELLDRADSQMQQGEQALSKSRGKEGQERLHEAQKLLDQAREEMNDQPNESGKSEGGHGSESKEKVDIPLSKTARDTSFRERVLRGLSKGSQSELLRDIIKRYTEELLKQ
jgi:hypothetical protein